MGGVITIDTALGQGTTIAFAMDMKVPVQDAVFSDSEPIYFSFDPASFRLLLAEDNRVNQIMARKSLEKAGFIVECCGNGIEALNALDMVSYDCALLDIQMPIMDGMEAARRIRDGEAGEVNRDIPLVALTAHAMTSDKDRFLASGMDAVVAKPFEMEELINTITELLVEKND